MPTGTGAPIQNSALKCSTQTPDPIVTALDLFPHRSARFFSAGSFSRKRRGAFGGSHEGSAYGIQLFYPRESRYMVIMESVPTQSISILDLTLLTDHVPYIIYYILSTMHCYARINKYTICILYTIHLDGLGMLFRGVARHVDGNSGRDPAPQPKRGAHPPEQCWPQEETASCDETGGYVFRTNHDP